MEPEILTLGEATGLLGVQMSGWLPVRVAGGRRLPRAIASRYFGRMHKQNIYLPPRQWF